MRLYGKKISLLIILFLGIFFLVKNNPVLAVVCSFDSISNCGTNASCLVEVENQCNNDKKNAETKVNTLSSQIAAFDNQIKLTTLKIVQTQSRIDLLAGRIDQLEVSLNDLTKAFSSRAIETYKLSKFENNFFFILGANNIKEATQRFHYLKKIEEEDRNLLNKLETAQTAYEGEKVDQEDLQKELEKQKKNLSNQKAAKAQLLLITKNDEKKYQDLLSKARAEIEAIQSIVAGHGKETEVGKIAEGSRIASVIAGSSACSSGGHLHFEVVKDGSHQNPANFLSNKGVTWDNSPDGQFGFSGSWSWPLNDPIRVTQGYGMTYYAANLRYYGGGPHTGIDIINPGNLTVKAVKPGTLFLGSIACGGGTLRYVHVKQDDNYDTFYLHVNY